MKIKNTLVMVFFSVAVLVPLGAGAEPRTINIGWLMIMDWDSDFPEAPTCLSNHPDRPSDWTINFEAIFFDRLLSGEQVITDYNIVVTTGHLTYSFTAEEKAILESYLDAGGIIWFDDCGNVEVDNLPYGMEINFGSPEYTPVWGTCYGDYYTINQPGHPLMNAVYPIVASIMRNDAGLVDAQWFTPAYDWDPRYTVLITGNEVNGYYSGPFILAARVSNGKIVGSFGDVTCALECVGYGNNGIPIFDYHFVLNMLAWVDSDEDTIEDWVEGAFEGAPATTPVDTDGDTISDYLDVDTDGDGLLDLQEAGDSDPDTPPVDSDGDTVPDYRDPDSDNDTIPDGVEERADADHDGRADPDADGDGVPNRLDPDSDNDGNPDAVEGTGDIDGDGIPNFVDANDHDGPAFREDDGAEGTDAALDLEGAEGIPDGADLTPDAAADQGGDVHASDVTGDFLQPDGQGDAAGDAGVNGSEAGCGCSLAR